MATRPSTLRTNPAASDTTYRRNPRETVADRIKRFERYEVRTEESKDYPLFGRGFLALAAQRYSEDEYVRLVAAALELDGRWGLLAEPSAYPAPKGVLLKALKDRYAAERTKPITVEVRFRDMWEATAYVGEGRYDRTEVGFVVAAPDYPLACPEEYATLRKAHGDAPTYEVVSSRVHPLMQRKGLGVRLYRALGETLGRERGAYLFANACGSRGDTSAEAQRVYRSLSRDFPAEGLVVYFPPTKVNPRRNGRGGYTSAMRTDPELWEEVKAEVTRGSKGGLPGQWSARKAQLAVALYKQRGGDYYGLKSPYNALAKWTREKWRTKSGRPSLETGERYLPSAAIAALTPAEYAATTRAKRAGMKKGQQFVPQPEAVAKKVGRYRRNPEDRGHILDLLDRLEEFKSSVMEAAGDDPYETTFDPMEYPIDRDTLRSYLDVPVLGWGASRVAVRLPSGNVAKLPWTSESDENGREWDRWQEASLEVQQMLLPPLEYVSGVLVFPHVRTVNDRDYDDPELAAARARWSALYVAGEPGSDVEDFRNTQNWGIHDGRLVLIDYAE